MREKTERVDLGWWGESGLKLFFPKMAVLLTVFTEGLWLGQQSCYQVNKPKVYKSKSCKMVSVLRNLPSSSRNSP